jgi:hypothetical protein
MQINYLHVLMLLFGLFLFQSPLQAQHLRSKAGDLEVGAQLGLLSIYRVDQANLVVPPVQVQGEVFITPNLSMGAFVAYVAATGEHVQSNTPTLTVIEKYDNQTWATGLRTTAYSNLQANKWRIYGGIALGATLPQVETTVEIDSEQKGNSLEVPRFSREPRTSLLFTGYVGTQYYLSSSISLTGEVGYGLSLASIGLRYKL